MSIAPVRSSYVPPFQPGSVASRSAGKPNSSDQAGDRVEIRGAPPEPATYNALRSASPQRRSDVDALLEESKKQVETFVRLLGKMVGDQGLQWNKVVRGEQSLSVDPATQKAAQEAIGPDGEFGVQKTAERILDFAKAAIGGDPEKVAKIRAAVEEGFAEAEKAFGGWLPDISRQTMDVVRSEFDRWEKGGLS